MSLPIATDENDSRLLKSRLPSKTFILDRRKAWSNLQCPLRKGMIYYSTQTDEIFEHDLYSSSNHKVHLHIQLAEDLRVNSFPSHGKGAERSFQDGENWHLHLSIHEIHSYRVGPALWTYHNYGGSDILELQPMESTTNALGITFGLHSESRMEVFDVSTDAKEDSDPLVKAGQLNYSRKLNNPVVLSPNRHILLHAGNSKTIDVFYSGTGDTDNMDFSFVTHVSIPNPNRKGEMLLRASSLVFSADGTKFAAVTVDSAVLVWDIRSKIPLKVFEADVPRDNISHLQFSSGILGREVLVFLQYEVSTRLDIIHLIDATSFETEEILCLGNEWGITIFFEPSGSSMYASRGAILYEWNLRKNTGPEWWLGET
ncbi:hypothetical protein K443DRAFT_11464 [Laccaria amethystina LaAM-08-1]|uniref:DUF2415 domain-containing protein n=1 Tax=Laccaria amethystina LaAM-08-1 TaxID=1095629 RepID=A0A0C9XGT0_9AGAR|nr:hypothetical protein K443DRAFT_11464 [Laccaria amethystina LaAM-08-1]